MLARAVADYLVAQGLGTVGGDLFVDYLPSQPDAARAVFHTGGVAPDGRLGWDTLTVQLRSRDMDPQAAYDWLLAAYSRLHGLDHYQLGGYYLVGCNAIQPAPVNIGRDQAGRQEYTLNLALTIRNQTTHRE
jgi:hypothetical protein